jgi:hypothetical protein
MILLRRIRTAPPVHQNFYGAKRLELNLELLKKKRDRELESGNDKKWKSSIWKEAKKQLLEETHDKCAYCETPTRVVAYGDVEHFRPKSIYWWLAYCYENYLASCTVCNQEYKKDHFKLSDPTRILPGPPVTAGMTDTDLEALAPFINPDPVTDSAGMPFNDFEREILGETALLIHPYHQNPAEYFAYEPILETQEVVVVPVKPAYANMVKAAENFYGINRKELMDLRFQVYATYMTYRHILNAGSLPEPIKTMCTNRLHEMAADHAAYAGMVRYYDTKKLDELPWDFNITLAGS